MATDLMQVSIGDSSVLHRTGPRGLPIRDVVPAADRDVLEPWLEKTPDQISWMERQLGVPYPFQTYGLLVTDTNKGAELETQTLPIFEKSLFTRTDIPSWAVSSLMVHELSSYTLRELSYDTCHELGTGGAGYLGGTPPPGHRVRGRRARADVAGC